MKPEEFMEKLKVELPDCSFNRDVHPRWGGKIQLWDISKGEKTIGFPFGREVLSGVRDADLRRWSLYIRRRLNE
tara:strand:- start:1480 stop:1701 length:222 start_codon:yes stop_codon:yes gene_type:complete